METSTAAQGLDAYYKKVPAMLNSPRVAQVFDLSAEPEKLRDEYGRHTYGQSCLLARRLIEAGVRFVNVYFSHHFPLFGPAHERPLVHAPMYRA